MSARRAAVLREMGLAPLWRLRARGGGETALADVECVPVDSPPVAPTEPLAEAPQRVAVFAHPLRAGTDAANTAPTHRRPNNGSDRARVPVARNRIEMDSLRPELAPDATDGSSACAGGAAVDPSGMDWETLESEIRRCTACRLCAQRKQAVPGAGDRFAEWMLVGEGPGAEEDRLGEPFVGAAGKLLDAMLAAIGLLRGRGVYIANAVKCRPPHNRTPERDEIDACFPFLARQIELVRPKLLVALGRPAAQALLKTEVSIGASRGKTFRYGATPVIVTYHPAYLLRNPQDKAKVWEDLCFARRVMREMGSV